VIGVALQPEPNNFDSDVRVPGNRLLQRHQNITGRKIKSYWKNISHDLHAAYQGICSYSCMYIMPPGSVDHFLPKTQYPDLSYEWSNYRLASQRVNQHKSDSTDVIDPFNVQPGWFVLDFPSCLVRPSEGLPDLITEQIENTISALKLNDDDTLVQERCDIMLMYAEGIVEIGFLSRRYPFLALEIERQNIQETVSNIFKKRSTT